jgi:DNA replication protein DnaC
MCTRKELFNTLLVELNEMGLPDMFSALDEMYRSPKFLELDPLAAIANLVQLEYQKKMNKRIQSRLRSAHLRGCLQELSNRVDSGDREYLPCGITGTLFTLDFIDEGMNVCILGSSDSGKSYLAKAVGIVACNTDKVEYHHCETLLEEMVASRLRPSTRRE